MPPLLHFDWYLFKYIHLKFNSLHFPFAINVLPQKDNKCEHKLHVHTDVFVLSLAHIKHTIMLNVPLSVLWNFDIYGVQRLM